jgi:hypothetical protein
MTTFALWPRDSSMQKQPLLLASGYLVKRIGIWREVGDEGVTRLVVGSDLQVLLLANLHQPPDRTISLPTQCCGSGSGIRDPGSGAFLTPLIQDPDSRSRMGKKSESGIWDEH